MTGSAGSGKDGRRGPWGCSGRSEWQSGPTSGCCADCGAAARSSSLGRPRRGTCLAASDCPGPRGSSGILDHAAQPRTGCGDRVVPASHQALADSFQSCAHPLRRGQSPDSEAPGFAGLGTDVCEPEKVERLRAALPPACAAFRRITPEFAPTPRSCARARHPPRRRPALRPRPRRPRPRHGRCLPPQRVGRAHTRRPWGASPKPCA